MDRKRIAIAILALGGQGGGVLADWILDIAARNGWRAQGTSVPGVAQRTGSTVYYIEMMPEDGGPDPILALMPVPGDVDVVIASELMEAGRAMLRGFVAKERTTLIGSTHRIYAIAEKSAPGDGRADSASIVAKATERAKKFVGFDMDAAASRTGSVISSVMLGALAGSGALPFGRDAFEEAIRHSGIAIEANLRGFKAGFDAAGQGVAMPADAHHAVPVPTTAAGRKLADRIAAELPEPAREFALQGVKRLMDYQDAAYAGFYLDRLKGIAAFGNPEITKEATRALALWMSYDDTIRVADLKIRASRMERVRDEIKVGPEQIIAVTEFMHPRLREVCETLPAGVGRWILGSPALVKLLEPRFQSGRHVETTSLRWFLLLRTMAGLRRWRRGTLRYREEQHRIEAWLTLVMEAAAKDPALALELVKCQRLIKGYGDTFDRGLANFEKVTALRHQDGAAVLIAGAREATLKETP